MIFRSIHMRLLPQDCHVVDYVNKHFNSTMHHDPQQKSWTILAYYSGTAIISPKQLMIYFQRLWREKNVIIKFRVPTTLQNSDFPLALVKGLSDYMNHLPSSNFSSQGKDCNEERQIVNPIMDFKKTDLIKIVKSCIQLAASIATDGTSWFALSRSAV